MIPSTYAEVWQLQMESVMINDSTAEYASHAESVHAKPWTEELEVAGDQLIALVKRLAAEGRVRRIRLVAPDGGIVLDIPLTVGAVAGGAVVVAAPLLAILGAVAAFVAKVKLEVVRDGEA